MKITCSSSSSSSAPNPNLSNPHNATTFGCFSSVLRSLFCSGGLRTHPFECVKDVHRDNGVSIEKAVASSVSPSLIARLMGLETLPLPDSNSRKNSIQKTRWATEMIPFFQEEDDEFLVLSFENLPRTTKHKKTQHHLRRQKKKKSERNVSKETLNKEEQSESCSPVSVLDNLIIDSLSEPESLLSGEEDCSRLMGSNSIVKVCRNSSLKLTCDSVREAKSLKMNPEVWEEVCKLGKEDMERRWSWSTKMEEIGIEFGLQILEQLVHDLVIELWVI